jgi:acetyl/propionyl-CoA carboxylase alpha subunit
VWIGKAMGFGSILIANRGEIAIRIARAAAELGLRWVAVCGTDDTHSLHATSASALERLPGSGASAYLDGEAVIAAALRAGCEAVHPGYGFLSESADFARACAAAGLTFIGPSPETLELFGDKTKARSLAVGLGIPIARGTDGATSLEEARAFLRDLGSDAAVALKPRAAGGGRGIRIVADAEDLPSAYAQCASEAHAGFGDGALYVEELIPNARHIEIQVVGDGRGAVTSLGERDCTLQRRFQKLAEFAPAIALPQAVRDALNEAALAMARASGCSSLCTFEFLTDAANPERWWFIEANPRLQVEHTVTEEVTGLDLVQTQIRIAQGASLEDMGLEQRQLAPPRGLAVQLRVNLEAVGTITAYQPPSGPGVRVDGYGYPGYATSAAFDPLLAKLVFSVGPGSRQADFERLIDRARLGLRACRIEGVETNLAFLQALFAEPAVRANAVDTRFVERHAAQLAAGVGAPSVAAPQEGLMLVRAPMAGVVKSIEATPGRAVRRGEALAILEAMKMEHVVSAEVGGLVRSVVVAPGAALAKGEALLFIEATDVEGDLAEIADEGAGAISPALAEAIERRERLTDARRPEAVALRRRSNQQTVRENIEALCDPKTFVEYGGLALAAQRRRRGVEELIGATPADGLVAGVGQVNGALFGPEASRCLIVGYDYTVLAGTQGSVNHRKTDRMFRLAEKHDMPLVLFAEGGGGRSGDTDIEVVAALETPTFANLARLSGRAPSVGVVSGYCFAGNAALLGCCDVIIGTADSSIGMAGPAMIEGGGLGVVAARDVGPSAVQRANGVIDIAVADEIEAVAAARQYLAYFQGPTTGWTCADQSLLRGCVPRNRRRVYDVRRVIEGLTDAGSVLELRADFGLAMVTALARIEGRAVGVIANDSRHLSGAIDSDAADKGARFLRLCDLYGLPVVSLCDTPGFMVGPQSEKTGAVRHMARMFIVGANMRSPVVTIVLRRAYGLGAMGMAGGGFHESVLTVAWPTGEFGGMGLEGQVRLGRRRELEAIKDPIEREARLQELVGLAYEKGKAVSTATYFEIDDVIDPAETRRVISNALAGYRPPPRGEARRPFLDPW